MYFVNHNGKKKIETFRNPSEMTQRRRAPIVENYGSGKKKCPGWLYWVLGGVALLVLIILTVWLIMSKRKKGSYTKAGSPGGAAMQRFGFRFY